MVLVLARIIGAGIATADMLAREISKNLLRTCQELGGRTLRRAQERSLDTPGLRAQPRTAAPSDAGTNWLALTGMRLGEVLSLQWKEIDFERGLAILPDSKTGRKPVLLNAPALAILAALPRMDACPYVIGLSDLSRPWAAVTKAAGLEGLRIHDLRHSFASIGAGALFGLPVIGKLLGHTQASTTFRYAHLGDDPMRRASESIGSTIAAGIEWTGAGSRRRADIENRIG
jgi:integrase